MSPSQKGCESKNKNGHFTTAISTKLPLTHGGLTSDNDKSFINDGKHMMFESMSMFECPTHHAMQICQVMSSLFSLVYQKHKLPSIMGKKAIVNCSTAR